MENKDNIYKLVLTEKDIMLILNTIANANNIKWVESNPLINKITQYYQIQKKVKLEKKEEDNGNNLSDNTGIDK